ncbi:uncharacterized protein V1516DRAFT_678057 [Lipomyces oligophaga]|uniref:uncharacterized protein n=1 Tax=Lipomyces oligophaga TaxID=45792 RepID=UPI0034CD0379
MAGFTKKPFNKASSKPAIDSDKLSFSLAGFNGSGRGVNPETAAKVKISFAKDSGRPGKKFATKQTKRLVRSNSPKNLITGFDSVKGSILRDAEIEAGPLVIPAVPNRNWIEESKRKRALYKPVGHQIDAEREQQADEQEAFANKSRSYGLTIRRPGQIQRLETQQKQKQEDPNQDQQAITKTKREQPQTIEEKRIEAIISELNVDRPASNLVVPITGPSSLTISDRHNQMSEEDAYKIDFESRPDQPSLEDYEQVSVEDFGFALLRGMGWKG